MPTTPGCHVLAEKNDPGVRQVHAPRSCASASSVILRSMSWRSRLKASSWRAVSTRELGVLAEEELHRERGVGEAARGVDPGPQAEGDVDRLDRLGRGDRRRPPSGRAGPAARSPAGSAGPVFARMRFSPRSGHQVGDRAHRDEVQVVPQLDAGGHRVVLGAQLLQEAVHELEDEPHGAEVLPGRLGRLPRAVPDVGVDEESLLERRVLGAVVVDDEDVDPLRRSGRRPPRGSSCRSRAR